MPDNTAPSCNEIILHVFDRPVTPKGWYFDVIEDWSDNSVVNDPNSIRTITEIFNDCKNKLKPFSDDQIAHGINYIFEPACGGFADLFYEDVTDSKEVNPFLLSIRCLYEGIFSQRCPDTMTEIENSKASKLQGACFMLWDTNHDFYFMLREQGHFPLLDVWKYALSLDNECCNESALHGLGHAAFYDPHLCEPIIDRFIETRRETVSAELLKYARQARTGKIL